MWIHRACIVWGFGKFFRVGLNYTDLVDYYKTQWDLKYKHNLSFDDFYKMIPYERQLFIDMTDDYIKELEKKTPN